MAKYLVTGAAGFIGSAIARRLISEGNEVVTIDNLSTGIESNIPIECEKIIGNVYDEKIIGQLNNEVFDAIVHIAGQSSGEISFENPVYDLNTNTKSTILLLDYARKTGCNNFIFASSMSVYGDYDSREEVCESSLMIPKSFYAVGKMASENYMRIFSSNYGIKCTALRFFNVYGIGQNMTNLKQGMASIYLAMAINDHHIVVKGSKTRFRDFVYIDDVVDAVCKTIGRECGEMFEVFNVSTDEKTTVENVVATIVNSLPYEVAVDYVEGTPGDQHGIYGKSEKLQNMLNWKPQISFTDGMKKMINWARKELEL